MFPIQTLKRWTPLASEGEGWWQDTRSSTRQGETEDNLEGGRTSGWIHLGLYIHTGHMMNFNLFQPAKKFKNVPVKLSIYLAVTEEALNAVMAIEITQVRVVGVCKCAIGSGLHPEGAGVCWQTTCSGWTNLWGVRVILHYFPFLAQRIHIHYPHNCVHGYVNCHNQNIQLHIRLSLGSRWKSTYRCAPLEAIWKPQQ